MLQIDFTGKTVIVTGSARGIGRRIAKRFYGSGANVVFCGRTDACKQEIIDHLAGYDGARFMFCEADVAKIDEIDALFDAAIDRFGGVDILVNNAGIWARGDIFDVDEEQWDRVIDTDLKSVFFASQRFCEHRRSVGEPGAIVNISSINAVRCRPGCAVYNVAKAGVKSVTETFAMEAGAYGIRVNAVGPGSIPTDLNAAFYRDPEAEKAYNATVPLGRRGTTDEVADAVLFLASDAASYLTGQTIYAEGGWLLH
ncbi:MAG: SDR family NAD(P)-dependent oxidoreductase [Kiritimatiellia bacterium]